MALSPWPNPTATAALRNAIERLKSAIGGRAEASDEAAAGLGAVAAALVEREAPGAPQAVKDEAVIRMAGYLAQADYGPVRQESIGPASVEYVTNHAPAFRNCGAKGLLSPWKIRRGGAA